MGEALVYAGRLTVVTCWCGIRHAIPSELWEWAHDGPDNATYCPLGHQGVYGADSESSRARTALERERSRVAALRAELDQAEADAKHQSARARGYQGALAKQKKRIGKGVCPCCNRHFADVERHMKSKHPEVADDAAVEARHG